MSDEDIVKTNNVPAKTVGSSAKRRQHFLAKYLGLLFVVCLPFLAGYIGYLYAPKKVVEVETIKEVEVEKFIEVEKNISEDRVISHTEENDLSGANDNIELLSWDLRQRANFTLSEDRTLSADFLISSVSADDRLSENTIGQLLSFDQGSLEVTAKDTNKVILKLFDYDKGSDLEEQIIDIVGSIDSIAELEKENIQENCKLAELDIGSDNYYKVYYLTDVNESNANIFDSQCLDRRDYVVFLDTIVVVMNMPQEENWLHVDPYSIYVNPL